MAGTKICFVNMKLTYEVLKNQCHIAALGYFNSSIRAAAAYEDSSIASSQSKS
jgi:hypothetical protein